MSKWHKVKITKVYVVLVEAEDGEDEDDAQDLALSEVGSKGDVVDCSVVEVAGSTLDTYKRHAHIVLDC